MKRDVPKPKQFLILLIGMLMAFSSIEFVNILIVKPPTDARKIASGPARGDFIPEMLNFSLDTFDDFTAAGHHLDNVSLFNDSSAECKLRLSTGLPDVTITGAFNTSSPFYAETIIMKGGAVWTPDGTDTIEIYARNFIMERGAVISASGVANNLAGRGDDGEDDNSRYSGGGGGGGGGYGDVGGKGGAGSSRRGTVDGGNGGSQQGANNSYEVFPGCRGGNGGHVFTTPGDGGLGGGKVVIISETISINGTIMANGGNGEDGEDGNRNNADTDGGGGGGSGGGLMIAGSTIEVLRHADFRAQGGTGGDGGSYLGNGADAAGGGGGGGGGRIKIFNGTSIVGIDNISHDLTGGSGGAGGNAPNPSRMGDVGLIGATGTFSINPKEFECPLDYVLSGTYISEPFDTGTATPHFDNITFSYNTPLGTSVEVFTQTVASNPMDPTKPGTWPNEWSTKYSNSNEKITSPDHRWIRAKIVLSNMGLDRHLTPVVDWLNIEYHADEPPKDLSMTIEPLSINTAKGEHLKISVQFKDSDLHSPIAFSGLLKLRNNSTGKELTLMNGVFVLQDNCTLAQVDQGMYELNYTYTPERYVNDGIWQLYLEVYDGATEKRVLDYNYTDENLTIFTNYIPTLDPSSLTVTASILPIEWNYTTTISFLLEDQDPYPLDDFKFTLKLKMVNGTAEYEIFKDAALDDIEELELAGTRGTYRFDYLFDPDESIEEGLYNIQVEVEDNMGEVASLDYNASDAHLDLKMNSPPTSPSWISPNETGEQTPRIAWSKAQDKDDDPLNYYVQLGTSPLGKDVLIKTGTGENNFYDITLPLPYGDYYVQVWAKDPYFFSPMYQEKMTLDKDINTPPRPPTMIMPNFTSDIFPFIKWSGAYDINEEDELTYMIQIGETPGGGEIVKKTSVGALEEFRVGVPLDRGKDYYVQVWSFDGKEESHPREEVLSVLTQGNHRPEPPTAIYPDLTGDQKPSIFWTKGVDADEDELTYMIQIGSSSGSGDIMHWTPTGVMTSFDVSFDLSFDTYYVQVKCSDSKLESLVLEEVMNVWASGNIPPTAPTNMSPQFTAQRYPDIRWEGANDQNEGDRDRLVYFIQIGSRFDGNEILAWRMTVNPHYDVTRELVDGVYYIQVIASDGMANSSVFQQKLYVGTFMTSVRFMENTLDVKKGRNYDVVLNVSNSGTIADIIHLDWQEVPEMTIGVKYKDVDLSNIKLEQGENIWINLTIKVSDSYSYNDDMFKVTATSIPSGVSATTTLKFIKPEEEEVSPIEEIMENDIFWPIVAIIIISIVIILVLIVIRRRSQTKTEEGRVYTEMVEEKTKPIRKKKSGQVTRVSDTPIMDPRAKRIAMAIYNAQSTALGAGQRKPDRLQLPSAAGNLPKIMVPDSAVGSTVSRKAMELKALPMASVVKDIDQRASVQKDISGLGQMPLTPEQKFSPSVIMPSEVPMGSPAAQDRMEGFTEAIFGVQTKLSVLKQQGYDVTAAEEKFKLANQYFGEKNTAALGVCLGEIDIMIKNLESAPKTAAPAAAPDFDISMPAPAAPTIPTSPAPAAAAPAPPSTPEVPPGEPAPPPGPPEESPKDGEKDVFSSLQNLIDGMG